MTEVWKAIPDWPHYEVSSMGRVRSLDRMVASARSRSGHRLSKGRVLKFGKSRQYHNVTLQDTEGGRGKKTFTVHSLVLTVFIEPRPEGLDVRHLDGNPTNNVVSNLTWGTKSENMRDKDIHGTNHHRNKTHCAQNHKFTEENTYVSSNGWRKCRTCMRARDQKRKSK